MRTLYARIVLWLIRPALELREPQVTVTTHFVETGDMDRRSAEQIARVVRREIARETHRTVSRGTH